MNLNLVGKNAFITGGANGIGEEIAYKLASEGSNIFVTSRKRKSITDLKKKLLKFNVKVDGVVLDFLKKNWIQKMKNFLKKKKLIF